MKTFSLKVLHDDSPINPFAEWDCEPPLVYVSWRPEETTYNSAVWIESDLQDIILKKKITLTLDMLPLAKYIDKDDIEENYREAYGNNESDYLYQCIKDEDKYETVFDMFETLCTLADVPYYIFESRWYSQGDYIKGIFILTPEYITRTGINPEDKDNIFTESRKLFDAYIWGDVYGYQLIEHIPLYREDGTLSTETEENIVDSCWGFYARDDLAEQLMGAIPQEHHHLIMNAVDNIIYR